MSKVGLVPLRVLRRIVELDADKDPDTIVGIHFPDDRFLIDQSQAEEWKDEGESFIIVDNPRY